MKKIVVAVTVTVHNPALPMPLAPAGVTLKGPVFTNAAGHRQLFKDAGATDGQLPVCCYKVRYGNRPA